MKKIFTLILALCWISSTSFGQLTSWDFNNSSNAASYNSPGTTASPATLNGVGTASFTAPGHNGSALAYTSNGWSTSVSIDLTDYLEFTMSTNTPGDLLSFTDLELVAKKDNDGPKKLVVYSSEDSYSSPLIGATITNANDFVGISVDLRDPKFSGLETLTIRIYAFDATTSAGTLTFDEIAFKNDITFVPVELAYFNAEKTAEKTANLNWATYSEFENATYLIERSSNGFDFEAIEIMDGAGTTTEFLTYEFIDENPMNGTNYYRLQMIDFYGESTYSDIQTIEFKSFDVSVNLFPNPVVDYVTVDFEKSIEASITVFNLSGQIVRQLSTANYENQLIINTNDLKSGQYFIRIQNTNNQNITKYFIKN